MESVRTRSADESEMVALVTSLKVSVAVSVVSSKISVATSTVIVPEDSPAEIVSVPVVPV